MYNSRVKNIITLKEEEVNIRDFENQLKYYYHILLISRNSPFIVDMIQLFIFIKAFTGWFAKFIIINIGF